MGYSTQYHLSIYCDVDNTLLGVSSTEEIDTYIKEKFEMTSHCFDNKFFWDFDGEAVKWYDHEKEMKQMSKQFQDVIFMLQGIGEEDSDKWIKYYLNGKQQYCEAKITIEFPKFDLKKFK